ncbi:MAG TPA: hypothetical protein VKQ72_01110 [Aggregatilineales bacterium]|nr:hypothetical protein [Aggregatilineales bacterium]
MASEPPSVAGRADQVQGNPSANYALILGVLSLVIALVSAFLSYAPAGLNLGNMQAPGGLGTLFGLLYFVGIPGFSLTGLLAGIRGIRASGNTGQGHTRALGGIITALVAILAFAVILFASIASFK